MSNAGKANPAGTTQRRLDLDDNASSQAALASQVRAELEDENDAKAVDSGAETQLPATPPKQLTPTQEANSQAVLASQVEEDAGDAKAAESPAASTRVPSTPATTSGSALTPIRDNEGEVLPHFFADHWEAWTRKHRQDLQVLLAELAYTDSAKVNLMRLADFACDLAHRGHEKECVGTILVFAPDPLEVKPHLQPMVPSFDVSNNDLCLATHKIGITNLCLPDGALVFDASLNLISCWQRLCAEPMADPPQEVGGAKHTSSMAFTKCCQTALAICVSESGGKVTFFHKGSVLVQTGPLYSGQQTKGMTQGQLEKMMCAILEREISCRSSAGSIGSSMQLTTSPSTNADSSYKLTFKSTTKITRDHVIEISDMVHTLCEESQVFQQVEQWLTAPNLLLHRNKKLRVAAHKWFDRNNGIVANMKDPEQVRKFVQELGVELEGAFTDMERSRCLADGAQIASEIGPLPRLRPARAEVQEFKLHLHGDQEFAHTRAMERDLQVKIEKEIFDMYKEEVTVIGFGSIILMGSERVFQSFQADLKDGHVKVADFLVSAISRGNTITVSTPIPVGEVLVNLRCWMMMLKAEEESVTEQPQATPAVVVQDLKAQKSQMESDKLNPPSASKKQPRVSPWSWGFCCRRRPVAGPIVMPPAGPIDMPPIASPSQCYNSPNQARPHPHNFSTAVLESQTETGYLRRFCAVSLPCIMSFEVPNFIVGKGLKELSQDHDGQWCGISGSDASCVAVQHLSAPELPVQIETIEDYERVKAALEQISSTHARTKLCVTVSGATIPRNYMVPCSDLEDCFGQDKFNPRTIVFFLPEFDVCPSSRTTFMTGDRAFFGCREKSFREICMDDKDDVDSVMQHLNVDGVLMQEMIVKTSKDGKRIDTKLLPGFKLLGHKIGGDFKPGLVSSSTAVFEVSPLEILRHNFRTLSPCNHHRFELDYFRIAKLKQQCCLGNQSCLVSRANSGLNILGIAREITQNDGAIVFSVDWFPGPGSGIDNGDLVLLPRVPAKAVMGEWKRFWHDPDVSKFADECPDFNGQLCRICYKNQKNSLLMMCGHFLCSDCAARNKEFCPFCRTPIERVLRFYPH